MKKFYFKPLITLFLFIFSLTLFANPNVSTANLNAFYSPQNTYDVAVDFSTFYTAGIGGSKSFVIEGDIYKKNKYPNSNYIVGHYICRGWLLNNSYNTVTQTFEIFGKGTIVVMGNEGGGGGAIGGTRAVVGATGIYSDEGWTIAHVLAFPGDPPNGASFRVKFDDEPGDDDDDDDDFTGGGNDNAGNEGTETTTFQNIVLEQNYPNPFSESTDFVFTLPENNKVAINIYNNQGTLVRTLANKQFYKGTHTLTWDGKDGMGNILPNGIYVYVLSAKGYVGEIRQMSLVR
jgi:FlgD Ig-like domain